MLRYKLWRLHSGILARHCRNLGIGFIPHPAAALDSEGFLAEPYYEDSMHVNADYGELLLDQMLMAVQ